jgi:hypothetical protein
MHNKLAALGQVSVRFLRPYSKISVTEISPRCPKLYIAQTNLRRLHPLAALLSSVSTRMPVTCLVVFTNHYHTSHAYVQGLVFSHKNAHHTVNVSTPRGAHLSSSSAQIWHVMSPLTDSATCRRWNLSSVPRTQRITESTGLRIVTDSAAISWCVSILVC